MNKGRFKKGHTVSKSTRLKIKLGMMKHGHSANSSETKTYSSWRSMIARCTNKNHEAWMLYGGRGIKVCKRWKSFESFLLDMGERPAHRSLDRLDSNKGYFQENCHWGTIEDQVKNRRLPRRMKVCKRGHLYIGKNIYVTRKGRRQCWPCMKIRERLNRPKALSLYDAAQEKK